MSDSYSQHFQDPKAAWAYDSAEYAEGSYAQLLWRIEQEQLGQIIDRLRSTHPRIDCLDFAAGSGRISAFLEDHVDSLTAIEISESMCERARAKLKKATVVCADITSPDAAVEGRYDLITAFRFILNAEPSLRLAGVNALARRLRDTRSVLVINNHGNFWSHKLLLWPYHALKRWRKGRAAAGNYLSDREVRALFREAGLRVQQVIGAGVLSARSLKLMSPGKALDVERRLSSRAILPRFGVNQMYVVSLDPDIGPSASERAGD